MSNKIYAHIGFGIPLIGKDGEVNFFLEETEFYTYDDFISSCFPVGSVGKLGVEFQDHYVDHEGTVAPVLVISSSIHEASTGENQESLSETLVPDPDWSERLKQFCLQTSIPFVAPRWLLWVSWDQ